MGIGAATGAGIGAAMTTLADRRPPKVDENFMMNMLKMVTNNFQGRQELPRDKQSVV